MKQNEKKQLTDLDLDYVVGGLLNPPPQRSDLFLNQDETASDIPNPFSQQTAQNSVIEQAE